MRLESINCLFMFSATKLFAYQRSIIIMLANEVRILLNQQAQEIQYASNKENYHFALTCACKTPFKLT